MFQPVEKHLVEGHTELSHKTYIRIVVLPAGYIILPVFELFFIQLYLSFDYLKSLIFLTEPKKQSV